MSLLSSPEARGPKSRCHWRSHSQMRSHPRALEVRMSAPSRGRRGGAAEEQREREPQADPLLSAESPGGARSHDPDHDPSRNQESETCVVAPHHRTNCGAPGITPSQCKARGCCFDNTISGVPWCFQPVAVDNSPDEECSF
ncbi:trefoil factor 1 isoform X1 [Mustela erminea]|uniref:trefoil factor 1 isoform X1 n=1 Tax=Mustela erminea TaxID=36723 RepID=UPI001386BE5F|nr:trefoil factor 1 isoform X1 [Mustela erminea]XP_032211894.1 trefoil factor 1 isoform X1 [Mustela erminea]